MVKITRYRPLFCKRDNPYQHGRNVAEYENPLLPDSAFVTSRVFHAFIQLSIVLRDTYGTFTSVTVCVCRKKIVEIIRAAICHRDSVIYFKGTSGGRLPQYWQVKSSRANTCHLTLAVRPDRDFGALLDLPKRISKCMEYSRHSV